MKINKSLVCLGLLSGLLLVGNIAHAGDLEEALRQYLADPSFDWLGHRFDEILFQAAKEANNGILFDDAEFIEKLKFTLEDIKTLPLQARCIHKMYTHKLNLISYSSLAGTAYLKYALGAKAFGKVAVDIFKLIK